LSQFKAISKPTIAGHFARAGLTTVFFDMGNTLADLNPSYEAIYHRVFQKAGYDLPLGDVERAITYSWGIVTEQDATTEYVSTLEGTRAWQREVEERVMENLGIQPNVREEVFWDIIQAFEDPASYRLYDDVLPTLRTLKEAGLRLAIISNWSWHLPELCDTLGLTPYFEQIFTSARMGFAKPHPVIFTRALAGMKITPHQAIHIGDSYKADVLGASQAGIQPLWLQRPKEGQRYTGPGSDQPGPALIIRGLEEVEELLGVKR
jgi:putative hydrolase of the HAD superfamily